MANVLQIDLVRQRGLIAIQGIAVGRRQRYKASGSTQRFNLVPYFQKIGLEYIGSGKVDGFRRHFVFPKKSAVLYGVASNLRQRGHRRCVGTSLSSFLRTAAVSLYKKHPKE